jgi:hypothetical protein
MEWTGSTVSNWNKQTAAASSYAVPGRNPSYPSVSVEEIVPPEKIVRNPFNGASYFFNVNAPSIPPPANRRPRHRRGLRHDSDGWNHFAPALSTAPVNNALYGGQSESSLEGLRKRRLAGPHPIEAAPGFSVRRRDAASAQRRFSRDR